MIFIIFKLFIIIIDFPFDDSNNFDVNIFPSPLHVMIPAYPYGDEREEGENGASNNQPLLVRK